MNTTKRKDNLRLYGCLRPKAAFDIYARCAISACMTGPGDASTAMEIRDQALRVWRAVPRTDKVKWDHLFEIRHSNVDIFKKGHELLKLQGMLAKLKPDYNTASKLSTIKHPSINHSMSNSMTSAKFIPHLVSNKGIIKLMRMLRMFILTDQAGSRSQCSSRF